MKRLHLSRRLWNLCHPPLEIGWIPPWRRHRRRCNEQLHAALRSGDDLPGGVSYCPTCDVWHLTPKNPVFWIVVAFGEV